MASWCWSSKAPRLPIHLHAPTVSLPRPSRGIFWIVGLARCTSPACGWGCPPRTRRHSAIGYISPVEMELKAAQRCPFFRGKIRSLLLHRSGLPPPARCVSRRTHRKSLSHSIISWFGLSTFGQGTTREHETSSPNLNIMVSTRSSPSAGCPITTMPRPASSPDSASPSTPKEIPDRHSFGTSVHCPLCSMRIDRSEPTPKTFFPGFRSQTALRERSSILASS